MALTHTKRGKHEYVPVGKEGFFVKLRGPLYVVISSNPELVMNVKDWSAGASVQDDQQTNLIDRSISEKCQLTRGWRNKQFKGVNEISASPLR